LPRQPAESKPGSPSSSVPYLSGSSLVELSIEARCGSPIDQQRRIWCESSLLGQSAESKPGSPSSAMPCLYVSDLLGQLGLLSNRIIVPDQKFESNRIFDRINSMHIVDSFIVPADSRVCHFATLLPNF